MRLGLIGTSEWSEFIYLGMLRDCADGAIVALAGRNTERLASLSEKFGVPHVFPDWREMIASRQIDAVIIAAPDELHLEMTRAAVSAGLAVMCEKPLAMNAADSRTMLDAVTDGGVINEVMFTWRHQPAARFVHELVAGGVIGTPIQSEFHFLMGYARSEEYHWRLDAEHGTGSLGDLGVHLIDFAQWMLSPITTVQASLTNNYARIARDGKPVKPTNDSSLLLVGFDDGSHGVISSSLVTELGDRFLVFSASLTGTAGTIEYELVAEGPTQGTRVYRSQFGQPREELEVPERLTTGAAPGDLWGHLAEQPLGVRQFARNVRRGEHGSPDFTDGHRAQLVIDAAFESHRSGRRVDVPAH